MGRAKNRECIDFATVHELPQYQARFDGLANTDIVRDQQTWHLEPERHEKRHKLIRPWFKGELRGRSERPGAATKCEPQCVRQERSLGLDGSARIFWEIEPRCFDRCDFQCGIQDNDVALVSRQRSKRKNPCAWRWERHPFAASGPNQIAR